jgi:hypothetical protein
MQSGLAYQEGGVDLDADAVIWLHPAGGEMADAIP